MDLLHEEDDDNIVMDLEGAADAFETEQIYMDEEPETMDEETMNKLRKIHATRPSRVRHRIMSMHMQQFTLLDRMGPKRLIDNPSNENDCYTHECNHCKTCMSIPRKRQGAVFKIPHIMLHVLNDI